MKNTDQPIGVFDSGIGGLTVAHAIKELLPAERLVYYGDTAHLPYGDKSEAAIQAYSVRIADFLLKKNCKAIVIACNSASSAAYDLLKEYAGNKSKIINVIDPMVHLIRSAYHDKRIGLIGTKRTINSAIYARKMASDNIDLKSLATPLLVPMIEEGFFNNKISREIIEKYLSDGSLQEIDALILGCTHYPLIKKQLDQFYDHQVDLLDSSIITARYLKTYLEDHDLLATKQPIEEDEFLVSDYTRSFEASARRFFKEKIKLVKFSLFD